MKRNTFFGITFVFVFLTSTAESHAMKTELKAGDPAPGFVLVDQKAKQRGLADFRGRWLVLYFYPKNNTPGCTTEACQFRDDHIKFDKVNADVLGVSIDNQASHAEFTKKYSLPFPLLADTDGKVASAYGSFFSFGPLKYAKRHTFIIDPAGRIAKIYRKVEPKTHSDLVLRDLVSLQKAGD